MKKPFKALNPLFFIALTLLSFIACDKDFNSIDSNVLGKDNANFNTPDRILDVLAYNKKLSNLQVNGLNTNLLGFYDDPVFGQTTASIVTQITPSSFNPDFGIEPVIDSVMINIPYFSRQDGVDDEGNAKYVMNEQDSLYGNDDIKLSIYRNNYFLRDFDPNSQDQEAQSYYSFAEGTGDDTSNFIKTENSDINFDDQTGEMLFSELFTPSTKPIEIKDGDESTFSAPALRLDLYDENSSFWENTIFSKEGETELSNANNFKNYFRGLYIKAEPVDGKGNMTLLNLAASNANITIYYSKKTSEDSDERTQATYAFNFSGIKLNTFINDYSTAPEPLVDGNDIDGDQTLYLKGPAGSMAVIDLFSDEDLEDLKAEFSDGGNPLKLINEAHLTIIEDQSLNTDANHKYDRLYAYDIKNNIPIIDYSFDPSENTTFPAFSRVIHLGVRDTLSESPLKIGYKIRITEHVKNLIYKDSTNTKIGLVISNNVNYTNNTKILNSSDDVSRVPAATLLTPRGTVLYGNTNTDNRIKLELYYTEPK